MKRKAASGLAGIIRPNPVPCCAQRYQLAIVRYGRHGFDQFDHFPSAFGISARSETHCFTPTRIPQIADREKYPILKTANIRNMSTDHGPMAVNLHERFFHFVRRIVRGMPSSATEPLRTFAERFREAILSLAPEETATANCLYQ